MVNVSLYLDTRRVIKNGSFPVKIRIGKKLVGTNMYARLEEWTGYSFSMKTNNAAAKNAKLNSWMAELEHKIYAAERESKRCSENELVEYANAIIKNKKPKVKNFIYYLDEYTENKKLSKGTLAIYNTTRNKIIEYSSNVTLEEMNSKWLLNFENWMSETMKINAYSIHLRNIRSVFNYAIDEEYTTLYPFRKFKIKKEATEKRCLSVEEIKKLRDYPVEEYQKIYRDMFMLMFYLIGINAVDLFGAKKEQVQNGRLVYKRAKTGTLYSIKIQPEAEKIIKTYTGEGDYLLNILDRYGNYKDFLHRMNKNLHRIGEYERKGRGGRKVITSAFPGLSSYWSRHTWATIAAELDVPIETISHALGHSIGSDVTAIYVKFNRIKIDEANRKVLDFLK